MQNVQEYRHLMSLVTQRTNAQRYGAPAIKIADLDAQVKTIQCKRELERLAIKVATLPLDARTELSSLFRAEVLGKEE